MPQVRLIGLVLFITTIFLAMVAAATQTSHIHFKQPTRDANGRIVPSWQAPGLQHSPAQSATEAADSILPPAASHSSPAVNAAALQFTAVPVVYPLLVTGTLGLLLWFVPAALTASPFQPRRSPKRRRRR